jgi:hypothetical protein
MIATFKQTLESLRNFDYGVQTKKLTLGQTLSYWFKYIILIGICGLVIGVGAVVYFTPQIPKLITEKVPEVEFAIKDGKLTTNQKLPFSWKDNEMEIYIDETYATFKNNEGKSQEIKFADIKEELSFNKKIVVDWVMANQTWLLVGGVILVLLLTVVVGSFTVLGQLLQMALWAVGFWILAMILKKNLKYLETLRFVIVASVPALVLDIFGLRLISMAVLAFYVGMWIYRLPSKNK